MKLLTSISSCDQQLRKLVQSVNRLAILLAFSLALIPALAHGHTSSSFLPLQFQGYYAPFGFDETETYTEVWGTDNGFAYLGSLSSGVAILDIHDPTAITTVAVFGDTLGVAFRDVLVAEGIGYFSSDTQGTYIVDVSDPSNPVLLTQVTAAEGAFDSVTNAIVDQNYLFQVSETSSEIAVFDVSNPSSPIFVTRIDTSDSIGVYDLSIQGNRLYAAGLGGWIRRGSRLCVRHLRTQFWFCFVVRPDRHRSQHGLGRNQR